MKEIKRWRKITEKIAITFVKKYFPDYEYGENKN